MNAARLLLALVLASGCPAPGSGASRPTAVDSEPAARTDCYAGVSSGMGQRSQTIVRRIVDPAAKTITEDISHDRVSTRGSPSFHVVMAVDGDHFTMTEATGAFTGTGTLVGQPWQWTSWSSVSQIANTTITVESHDELTATGVRARKQIKQDGKVIATTVDDLRAFECAQWDDAKAALLTPVLDRPNCDRTCRNYATLKFWDRAKPALSALPEADRAAAHAAKATELADQLAAGIETCIGTCLASNNPRQAACWGDATSVAQLAACDNP